MKAAPVSGWKQFVDCLVKRGAAKADEAQWSGLQDWLDLQQGKVSKEQVKAYLDQNGVKARVT